MEKPGISKEKPVEKHVVWDGREIFVFLLGNHLAKPHNVLDFQEIAIAVGRQENLIISNEFQVILVVFIEIFLAVVPISQ